MRRTLLISVVGVSLGCAEHVASDPSSSAVRPRTLPNATRASGLSYATDIEPLWTPTCIEGCHPGSDSMADLRTGQGWSELVDVPAVELPTMDRVQPGDPDRSYLMLKLNGTHLPEGGMGPPMPPSGVLLSEADRATIRQWITEGAPP